MARVYVSTVVNARSDRLWVRVRDFNGLPNWHPAIAESRIEGGEPPDKIGCIRDFRLRNGERIRCRQFAHPSFEIRNDRLHLRLLQHDFGHQDVIRVAGLSPGQIASVAPIPREQPVAKAPAIGWHRQSRRRRPTSGLAGVLGGHIMKRPSSTP